MDYGDEMNGLGEAFDAQIYRELGIGDLNKIAAPNRYGWDEVIDGPSAGIATGGGKVIFGKATSDTGYAFCVQEILFDAWPTAAYLTNVPARSPVAVESAAGTAASVNDMIFRSMLALDIKAGALDFFSAPAIVSLIAGTIARPSPLMTRRWIAPGSPINVSCYNNSTAIITGQLILRGFRVLVPRARR